jgi:hypothetical protein
MTARQYRLFLAMAALLQVTLASLGQTTRPTSLPKTTQPASRPGASAAALTCDDLSRMLAEKAFTHSLVGRRIVCVVRVDKVNDETRTPTPAPTGARQNSLAYLAHVGQLTLKDILDAKNPSLTDMTEAKADVDKRLAAKRSRDKGQEDSLSRTPSTPGRNTNAEFSNLVARNRKEDAPLAELSDALANRIDELNRFPYRVSGTTGTTKLPVIATVSSTSRRILEKVKPGDEVTLTGLIESVSPASVPGTFTVSLARCQCTGIVPPAPAAATLPTSQPAAQPTSLPASQPTSLPTEQLTTQPASQPTSGSQRPGKVIFFGIEGHS